MKTALTLLFVLSFSACGGSQNSGTDQQEFSSLGRKIFFDANLSDPKGVSCASCHNPQAAFTDPSHSPVSNGAFAGRVGLRNTPTILYAMFSPVFGFSEDEGDYVGGQFWDGRARDLVEQPNGPIFQHLEMNLADAEDLRQRIENAPYVQEFIDIYGKETLADSDQTLSAVLNSLSIFENSPELQPFSSKYDAWANGRVKLSEQEMRGLALYNAPNKGNCAACHPSTGEDGSAKRALFTDFTYDNIGLPSNTDIENHHDIGLLGTTGRPSDIGRFKVPTLRNVELTSPYFHHGVFSTLKEVVHFYNSRDTDPSIAEPEFPSNMNISELGDLGLSDEEEEDIVVFLRTLNDGFESE